MGDSDDDYDRRRRDKFRGERNDYDNRRPPPSRGYDRGRGERSWNNDRKRNYYGNNDRDRRDRNMDRGSSPPAKRKRDWESGDNQWRPSGHESNAMVPAEKGSSSSPSLMSFKDFIIQQEDSINENEAVRRYQEYKLEFKRTQINDFFVLHKAEEWFEEKYHPSKSVARKKFIRQAIRKRLRIFLDLWEDGYMDDLNMEITNNSAVLKLLDRVVIKLEGGTDEDLKSLDFPPKPVEVKSKIEEETKPEGEKKPDAEPEKMETEEEKPKNYTYDADTVDEDDNENEAKEPLPPGMDEEDLKPPGMEEDAEEEKEKEEEHDDIKKEDDPVKEESVKPYVYEGNWPKRPLSIFFRSLLSNITRDEIVNICKRYPGFLRVGLSEAVPERRYGRRGWVTFGPDTNIKDVCWNLSNIRVKDMELNPAINRDVNNRVRSINGISCSPMAMQLDLNNAVKLIKKLDAKISIYEVEDTNGHADEDDEETKENASDETKNDDEKQEGEEEGEGEAEADADAEKESEEQQDSDEKAPKKEIIELPDENPLLAKLPEGIEELITGIELGDEEDDQKDYPIVINEELRQWLDLLLMYLRVVHSFDYYNVMEYHNENEMPLQCGIVHVRSQQLEVASKKDVHEYFNGNKTKLEALAIDVSKAKDEEAVRFGKKNEETEVENFIKANTQELAKDKWLCPLSGKKFRGPEFVRKHILMKHTSNVDNVRMEVQYFNNYIYDLNRPCFPEAKPKIGGSEQSSSSSQWHGSHPPNPSPAKWQSRPPVFTPKSNYGSNSYAPSTPQPAPMQQETYGRMNTFPPKQMRRGGNYHDRKIIKYRDLDAPEESDFF